VTKTVEQYVLHNQLQFEPIEFLLEAPATGDVVLIGRLFPGEFVLMDGARRLLSISFSDTQEESEGSGIAIAKLRHPTTGIKQWEFVEEDSARTLPSLRIVNCFDEAPAQYTIEPSGSGNLFRLLASHCGCLFSSHAWCMKKAGASSTIADIAPSCGFWTENSMDVQWPEKTENEGRVLATAFGLVQMIREAHPSLYHILMEQRGRRTQR